MDPNELENLRAELTLIRALYAQMEQHLEDAWKRGAEMHRRLEDLEKQAKGLERSKKG